MTALLTGLVVAVTGRHAKIEHLVKLRTSQLSASEAWTRLIVDSAPDAVIAMDSQGRIIEWNKRAEVTFGWQRHEAIGRELAQLIIPESLRAPHRQGLQRFLDTGEGRILGKSLELTAIRRSGGGVCD
jgi:PAS domain S-box-containing protein